MSTRTLEEALSRLGEACTVMPCFGFSCEECKIKDARRWVEEMLDLKRCPTCKREYQAERHVGEKERN